VTKITITPNASGTGTFTVAAPNSNSSRTFTLPDETGTVLTSVSNLDATNLTGNLPAISGAALTNLPAPTSSQVGTATANLAEGAVGTYALAEESTNSAGSVSFGSTVSGSVLLPANLSMNRAAFGSARSFTAGSVTGTWRCMGYANYFDSGTRRGVTLWLRIS
jgi:hypothetical protein